MTLSDALLAALKTCLPAPAFLALLDVSLPLLAQEPDSGSVLMRVMMQTNEETPEVWAEVVDRLINGLNPDLFRMDTLVNRMNAGNRSEPVAQAFWNGLRTRFWPMMTDEHKIQCLSAVLRQSWSSLVARILNDGCPTDVGVVLNYHNPFNALKTPEDAVLLLHHGFDPWQQDKGERAGYVSLCMRGSSSFRCRATPQSPWTSRGAKAAVLRVLGPDPRPLDEQVHGAIVHAHDPEDLRQMLEVIGPSWMDHRSRDGGTVWHTLTVLNPSWIGTLLRRPDVRRRGLAWCTTPDLAGRHPWELVWLNARASAPVGLEPGGVWALEADLQAHPDGAAWLHQVPRREGGDALDLIVEAAIVWERELPSFNHPTWWSSMVLRGGNTAGQAWQRTRETPRCQARLDHLVWEVLAVKDAGYAENWFNLDLWADDPDPWLATYRLLSSMLFFQPAASPESTEAEQHRYHLDRALQAIGQGADQARAQAWIDAGKVRQDDGRRQVWHCEVFAAWEGRALRHGLTDAAAMPQPPRRRL